MATEKRLIDANALITYFEGQCDIAAKDTEKESLYVLAALKCCIDLFQNFPAVDAVEVVNGEWEITEDDYFDLVELKCSVCGESYGFENYEDCIPQNYHYCPNCGAKMDGDGND